MPTSPLTRARWRKEWRRTRCGSPRADQRAVIALTHRQSHWERCVTVRAYWLSRDTMRCHKLTLMADCWRALDSIRPRLPH